VTTPDSRLNQIASLLTSALDLADEMLDEGGMTAHDTAELELVLLNARSGVRHVTGMSIYEAVVGSEARR
jgi:hypothetical protein